MPPRKKPPVTAPGRIGLVLVDKGRAKAQHIAHPGLPMAGEVVHRVFLGALQKVNERSPPLGYRVGEAIERGKQRRVKAARGQQGNFVGRKDHVPAQAIKAGLPKRQRRKFGAHLVAHGQGPVPRAVAIVGDDQVVERAVESVFADAAAAGPLLVQLIDEEALGEEAAKEVVARGQADLAAIGPVQVLTVIGVCAQGRVAQKVARRGGVGQISR